MSNSENDTNKKKRKLITNFLFYCIKTKKSKQERKREREEGRKKEK